ncbi:MAG: class II aldolase/adducin family protein [Xanthobacteraceae bacterium]
MSAMLGQTILTANAPGPELIDELVIANKILFHQNVVDAFGHISARHDKDRNKYLMARHLPPQLVTAADIVTFDLDSNPLTHQGMAYYSERFIHGEIYKVRPDVVSVVHCHARPLIPFGTAKGARLRPIYHMTGFLAVGVPVFEIRDAGGMTDMLIRTPALGKALASCLCDKAVVLMRGHGATMVGASIRQAVFRAVYSAENATLQMEAHRLAQDGEVEFLTAEEGAKVEQWGRSIDRAWALWKHEVMS